MTTPEQVTAFLGQNDPKTLALAEAHLPVITNMVRAYTRDEGFDPVDGQPNDEIAAVIVSVTARSVGNPEQKQRTTQTSGPFTTDATATVGFTLPEIYTLNRYRKRCQL